MVKGRAYFEGLVAEEHGREVKRRACTYWDEAVHGWQNMLCLCLPVFKF